MSSKIMKTAKRRFCDGLPRDVWRLCKVELRCLKCAKRYSDWRNLRRHMNYFCQMEPLYPCPYCSHRARIPTLLKYHIAREHAVPTSRMEMRYSGANNYDFTYLMHKRHVCPHCKKVFLPKSLLKRHIQFGCKLNPRNTTFSCSFCPYKSMYKANMERHVRNVHNTGSLKFFCELCNFRSNYSYCIRRHMRTFHRMDESQK
ncbi:PREDICTED: transcriptional repressor CTCF-like [Vollenhovia emeryi]|uniref:transcriptional repressor CTCF-like n=1 Tax=Vollenhovia emeryi TaxID=411798 RepID=UPI0005F4D1A6|nr:PREDICTED: transcriptional repressor CTCF-like [Vollenhovia emeryi]